MTECPFSTGPLRDWPHFQHAVDRAIGRAIEQCGAAELGEYFREEVLDNLAFVYSFTDTPFAATFRLSADVTPIVAQQINTDVRTLVFSILEWSQETKLGLVMDRAMAAVAIVQLRRRLRQLGAEPPWSPPRVC